MNSYMQTVVKGYPMLEKCGSYRFDCSAAGTRDSTRCRNENKAALAGLRSALNHKEVTAKRMVVAASTGS